MTIADEKWRIDNLRLIKCFAIVFDGYVDYGYYHWVVRKPVAKRERVPVSGDGFNGFGMKQLYSAFMVP